MPQTGATRYQKFLKSEKSKTKLKAKKKELPKGTNVTKTNFKVKKIVIKEQLKKHGTSEILSTKKLNIKELLSRLNHFNKNSRTEALEGLKEIISSNSDAVSQNLGQVILGVTPLVLNIEKVVRHEALKVLHSVLTHIDLDKVDPFFDIMSTYLRSAMTHIDTRIQEDSLLFLDLLLSCTPKKVIGDFHKILPIFLDMISKLRVDSKPGRTLTVNLSSQITSVKWRVKVLHRLEDFLNKYIHDNMVNANNRPKAVKSYNFDETQMNYYPLFNPVSTAICHVSSFSAKSTQDFTLFDEVEKFKEYFTTLIPLLYETWLEVCPKATSVMNIETVVNEDAASLLKHTLKVISHLHILVQHLNVMNPSSNIEQIFCQKNRKLFTQHLVNSFPYVTNVRTKQIKSNISPFEDVISDPKMVAENLTICHLFVNLNPNVNMKNQSKEFSSVIGYIEKNFSNSASEPIKDMIINILDTIFTKGNSWTKSITIMDSLFSKIIREYFNTALCMSFKQQIFGLLCKVALNDNLINFQNRNDFKDWIRTLPNILLENTITMETVNIIHIFAIKNNVMFNDIIKQNLLKIIENLPKLVICDDENSSSYYKLFSLLYWIKNWDHESLNLLEQQLMNNEYKNDHCKYIFDTLRLRVGGIL
ncbi:unnamed protein product [Diatraea saccharalis]|uniref:Pre-rRNA-processing protein Ipi1 N-terminal domain-containing protein n=1 Tax=Diatraea saccharalis TaxID=40085 RepID=A0A9N9R1S3_9NEOP|nr:unnamed protein product [Diatraea saccharalis]